MKVMYRGIRVKDGYVDDILKEGMDYCWRNTEHVMSEVFNAIRTHKILKKLVNNHMLECRIMEACTENRLQIYGSEEKNVAESYARATPELIYLTLQNGLVKQEKIYEYLNKRFGQPYVVTFSIDAIPTYQPEINKSLGQFIAPEYIVSVEPVDITKKDPIHERFQTI